ncbi:Rib/alpha-like domain-containing protein [Streptococcus anginosus]|uniref:Rib/alpha-like domain-containing protein n=7 Tax=Streptococcus anginosus TaxID=1328 RepID=UPI00253FF382|nr:Rib/alpha-like domain-containing protein [Streptococcus anginosus]WIK86343.1 Rib/alpha-like domain-containing protein [Streptococcus anginosus]
MYFNRKNAEQKNWRMIKKGKHFLFGCSLVFAVGAALVAPSVKADATVETKPETGSTTETKPEAGPTTETTKATAGEENVTYAAPAAEAQTPTEANAKSAPAPATPAKAEEKAAPVAATTKESDSVAAPSLTTVADASALTAEEISNVTEAIKGVNPTATDVKVSKDGSAVVTFKDGSSATLAASQTVKVKAEATSEAPTRRTRALSPENAVSTRSFDSELQKEAQKKAIYSPGVKGGTQTYQGTVWLYRNGIINDDSQEDSKRLGGVNVYLQYVTGEGFVSPVYKTTSGQDGTFVFDLSKPVTNSLGETAKFELAGDPKLAIRTWVENPNPEKYNVIKSGDQRTGFHGRLSRLNESWDFTAGVNRIVGGQVVLQEKPNAEDYLLKPEAERQKGNLKDGQFSRKGNYGTIQGRVWYELRDPSGSDARMYKKDSYDINATNVKVAASYLNDEVTRLLDQWKKDNKNYKLDDFKAAQAKIIKEYEAKHGKGSHIAETVVVPVDKDGNYRIPFRGLYGVSATQANSGAKISHKVSDKEFGTLVKDEDLDNETLMKWNGTIGQKHRHINTDYVYATVLVNNYAIWSNNYQSNMFEGTSDAALPVGPSSLASANISNTNFVLVAPQPMHDILVYDNTDNFAKPGNTAESTTGGLVPSREYQIRWFKDGKAIGEATTVMSTAEGTAKSVPLTVENDLTKPAIYTSAVFLQGEKTDDLNSALALDSFTAVPDDETDKYTPEYADTLVTPGTPATVTPTFKGKDNAEAKAPEGATYSIPSDFKAPEGYTVTIDPNTGAITTEAKPGTKIEEVDVPVTVTYKDKSTDSVTAKFKLDTDGDGIPDVTDDDDDNDGVKDTDETTDGTNTKDPNSIASKITPIDDQTGVVGKEITPVTVTVEKIPTDGSVKVEGLPDGVSYDPATKQITGTPTTEGVSKVTVTVLGKDGNPVKGADGNPVTETFTFTVTTKDADKYTPEYADTLVTPGTPATVTPTFKGKDNAEAKAPEGATYSIPSDFKAPEGYTVTIDPNTGAITTEAKPGTKIEEVDVPVTVTYKDKSTDSVTAKFKLDTDGDGIPDVTDDDDDNDGVKDTDETTDGTNTKDPNSIASKITPIDDQTGVVGKEITPVTVTVEKIPTDGSVKVEGLPDGVSYDPATKQITGTPTTEGVSKVTVTVLGKDGNPVKGADGNPVTETFTFTVTTKDADKYTPEYADTLVTPGKPATVTPTFKGKDNAETKAPEGATYSIPSDFKAPEGYTVTIDPNTGAITTEAKPGTKIEEVDVPVTVTYKDKSTDSVTAKFKLDTDGDGIPDVTDDDDDNDGVKDTDETTDGTNTKDPNSIASKITPIDDQTGVVGKEITPVTVTVEKIPTDGSVKVEGLPDGVSYDPATKQITGTPTTEGVSKVTVTVLGKDGNPVKGADGNPVTETFTFTVTKAPTQAEENTPTPKEQTVNVGETPDPKKSIGNVGDLPEGTKFEYKTPVDTSTPGDKDATVVVTYPDGSKDEVPVKVTVTDPRTDADKNTPTPKEQTVNVGETPDPKKSIGNVGDLPEGTKFEYKTPVDTTTPGDKDATVVVTYPDGSKDEVPVKVTVTDPRTDADKNTPTPKEQTVNVGETPDPKKSIGNVGDLPEGTKFEYKTPVDTSTPGDKDATVVVTYPDGSKDEVPVKVTVTDPRTDADKNTPTPKEQTVNVGETPDPKKSIGNVGDLPEGTKFEFKTPVDTTTPGDKSTTVVVTYPDGSKDEVPVTVKVVDPRTDADKNTPTPKEQTVNVGETPDPKKSIGNVGDLPEGTKFEFKTPVDTTTPGDKDATVVVTYPDGSKDEVPVKVTVTDPRTDADKNTPTPKEQTVNVGETPDPKKSIGNVGDLPEGTKFEFKTPVDTTTPGDKDATVVVTYPDGSKDEVPVKVTVADNSAQASDSTPAKKAEAKELPNTGTEAHAGLATLGLLGALSGFGLLSRKKKED